MKVIAAYEQSGLTVTVDIYDLDDGDTLVVSGGAMTEIGSTGVYKYAFTGYSPSKDYLCVSDGGFALGDGRYRYVPLPKGDATGSGNTERTYQVVDASGNPLPGVTVEVRTTSDVSGDVVASGVTDHGGNVTFYLDAGTTYYLWRQKTGYIFNNPDQETA